VVTLLFRAALTESSSVPMHTDTVAGEFTCTHCGAVPEQVIDGKATIAIVRHKTRLPDADGPDPHTLARPSA
jgi:hypothetical protein